MIATHRSRPLSRYPARTPELLRKALYTQVYGAATRFDARC